MSSRRAVPVLRGLVTIGLLVFVVGMVITAPPPAEDRATEIGARIRCPVCTGESIADSPAPLATEMMNQVRTLLDQGYTDDQVIDTVLASYGRDAYLLDPPLTPATVALWAVPGLVLMVGVAMAGRRLRGKNRRSSGRDDPTGALAGEQA